MAVLRDRPYVQFNFLVQLDPATATDDSQADSRTAQTPAWRSPSRNRTGNMKENSVIKITGLTKATDVTLKRGVIGKLDLYNWLNDIRNGDQNAFRVAIHLQNEDHIAVVMTWKLRRARIIKHVSGR